MFSNIPQSSRENTCARVSFLIKLRVSGFRLATLLKKRHLHRRFPVNFAKFSRILFLQEKPKTAASLELWKRTHCCLKECWNSWCSFWLGTIIPYLYCIYEYITFDFYISVCSKTGISIYVKMFHAKIYLFYSGSLFVHQFKNHLAYLSIIFVLAEWWVCYVQQSDEQRFLWRITKR